MGSFVPYYPTSTMRDQSCNIGSCLWQCYVFTRIRGQRTGRETIRILNKAIIDAGGWENLFVAVKRQLLKWFRKHPTSFGFLDNSWEVRQLLLLLAKW